MRSSKLNPPATNDELPTKKYKTQINNLPSSFESKCKLKPAASKPLTVLVQRPNKPPLENAVQLPASVPVDSTATATAICSDPSSMQSQSCSTKKLKGCRQSAPVCCYLSTLDLESGWKAATCFIRQRSMYAGVNWLFKGLWHHYQ